MIDLRVFDFYMYMYKTQIHKCSRQEALMNNDNSDLDSLTMCALVWHVADADLSYQAAQRVLSASDGEQLATLRDISQNFPVQTR